MAWMPGEELLIKIVDTLKESIVGGISPWQIQRKGKAENDVLADQKIKLAMAEDIIQRMGSGELPKELKGNVLEIYESRILPASNNPNKEIPENVSEDQVIELGEEMPEYLTDLTKSTSIRMIRRELQREINVRKIAIIAQEEAQTMKDEPVSEEPVAPDWLSQWFNLAQDVSDKDLQIRLGKILAGETKTPGSFSLKTLDFLRTASKETLEQFKNICVFQITNSDFDNVKSKYYYSGVGIYNVSEQIFKEFDIKLLDIVELEEEGLISSNASMGFQWEWAPEQIPVPGATHSVSSLKGAIQYGQDMIYFEPRQIGVGTKVVFPIFNLSRVGKDLVNLGQSTTSSKVRDMIVKQLSASCIVKIESV